MREMVVAACAIDASDQNKVSHRETNRWVYGTGDRVLIVEQSQMRVECGIRSKPIRLHCITQPPIKIIENRNRLGRGEEDGSWLAWLPVSSGMVEGDIEDRRGDRSPDRHQGGNHPVWSLTRSFDATKRNMIAARSEKTTVRSERPTQAAPKNID